MLRSISVPLWTKHKARLIQRYLQLFVLITKHGAYIDGFAGPQARDHAESEEAVAACTAKLVLESEPAFLRDFWLCDADPQGAAHLRNIVAASPQVAGRTIEVLEGDFNQQVARVLSSGRITETTASFCLVDQRMFECDWATVEAVAGHKKEGPKIELFYFLGSGWLHRSMAGTTQNFERIERWWGRPDWRDLEKQTRHGIAAALRDRFRTELGYAHVTEFPIYERDKNEGPVMYHMIHCSDHPEALRLMRRAYGDVTGVPAPPVQPTLEALWQVPLITESKTGKAR